MGKRAHKIFTSSSIWTAPEGVTEVTVLGMYGMPGGPGGGGGGGGCNGAADIFFAQNPSSFYTIPLDEGSQGFSTPVTVGTELSTPFILALDSSNTNVYVADIGNNVIRKINISTGIITTVAGTGVAGYIGDGGLATGAQLNGPYGISLDSSNNLYIADLENNVIRRVSHSTGIITTVVGTGAQGYTGDSGPATSATLNNPYGVSVDSSGNIYIADTGNNVIRKVTSGTITTFAGTGTAGFTGNGGAASSATLDHPNAVLADSSGNIYISDTSNNAIRKVTSGTINAYAGTGTAGYTGDGAAATSAELTTPIGLALDSSGNLYIADFGNQAIRKVTLSTGFISTVAGNGIQGHSGDGSTATSARLNNPVGVAFDSSSNLYISDSYNNVIRKVASSNISNYAGNTIAGYQGNGFAASGGSITCADLILATGFVSGTPSGNITITISSDSTTSGIFNSTLDGNDIQVGPSASNTKVASPFNLPASATVTELVLYHLDFSVTTGTVTIGIYPDSGGVPGASALWSTNVATTSILRGSNTFSVSSISLSANTQYWVVIDATSLGGVALIYSGTNVASSWKSYSYNGTWAVTGVNGFGLNLQGSGGTVSISNGPGSAVFTGSISASSIKSTSLGVTYSTVVVSTPLSAGNYWVTATGDSTFLASGATIQISGSTVSVANVYAKTDAIINYDVPFGQLLIPNATFPGWGSPFTLESSTSISEMNLWINNYGASQSGNLLIALCEATNVLIDTYVGDGTSGNGGDGGPFTSAQLEGPYGVNYGIYPTSGPVWAITGQSGSYSLGGGGEQLASHFTLGLNSTVTNLQIEGMNFTGATGGDFRVAIRADSSGLPSASNLWTTSVATSSLVVGTNSFTISPGLALTAGVQYWFVIDGPGMSGGGTLPGGSGPASSTWIGPPTWVLTNGTLGLPTILTGNVVHQALYIADGYSDLIRQADISSGIINTYAGSLAHAGTYYGDGGPATSAGLYAPSCTVVDSSGNLYIADRNNNAIRKVTNSTGIITTVAGTGSPGYTGDTGAATSATLDTPFSVTLDSSGNIYIADTLNNVVRKVTIGTGIITTIAGTGTPGYTGDGFAATSATLNQPYGVVFDSLGNLYISDNGNNVIRKVTTGGIISTYAGTGTAGHTGDGGPATSAELNDNIGIAVDSSNNLYISQGGDDTIRVVTYSTGIINTIAGNGTSGYFGDGGAAISASFGTIVGITLDASNNVYVADRDNSAIRQIYASDTQVPGSKVWTGSVAVSSLATFSGTMANVNVSVSQTIPAGNYWATFVGDATLMGGGGAIWLYGSNQTTTNLLTYYYTGTVWTPSSDSYTVAFQLRTGTYTWELAPIQNVGSFGVALTTSGTPNGGGGAGGLGGIGGTSPGNGTMWVDGLQYPPTIIPVIPNTSYTLTVGAGGAGGTGGSGGPVDGEGEAGQTGGIGSDSSFKNGANILWQSNVSLVDQTTGAGGLGGPNGSPILGGQISNAELNGSGNFSSGGDPSTLTANSGVSPDVIYYPNGSLTPGWQAGLTIQGTATIGSPTLTGITSTAGISNGMYCIQWQGSVDYNLVQYPSTVSSFVLNTSVTLNNNALASGTSYFTFFSLSASPNTTPSTAGTAGTPSGTAAGGGGSAGQSSGAALITQTVYGCPPSNSPTTYTPGGNGGNGGNSGSAGSNGSNGTASSNGSLIGGVAGGGGGGGSAGFGGGSGGNGSSGSSGFIILMWEE